jgi:folate-binding protein YgfZ
MIEILSDRAVITLSGADRRKLLHGIITNSLERLTDAEGLYSALLTPQGKFLHDFFLFEFQNILYLDCQKSRADDLVRRLMMYRLRADVEIKKHEALNVFTSVNSIDHKLSYKDPRHEKMGYRAIVENGTFDAADMSYHKRRISLGIPEGTYDFIPEKSTIHEGHFEQINGVDFKKGCYVGQEVIARMKYRGKIKKAMFPVTLSGIAAAFGSEITDKKGNKVGDLRSHCDKNAIVLFRIADMKFGIEYDCCGIKVTPYKPDFYKDLDDE